MKGVELKKYEIDYRGKSRPTALFVKSGQSEFHRMNENNIFFIGVMQQK